ncbi:MAG: hypothetical protein LBS55_03490 [Prevotellaceae bacterium]|jgi:hypothetical protein|nr:hypothetical protein [Prevotellaceae bacterium]
MTELKLTLQMLSKPQKIYFEDVSDVFVAADDIETSFADKIPLWLFGLLY